MGHWALGIGNGEWGIGGRASGYVLQGRAWEQAAYLDERYQST